MATHVENTEEKQKKSPRPEVVPRLELRDLVVDEPVDKILENPVKKKNAYNSPTSRSDVSWGTPLSPPYALTTKDIDLGGTIHRPCTHVRHRQATNPQRNPITHKQTPVQVKTKPSDQVIKETNDQPGTKKQVKVSINEEHQEKIKSPKNTKQKMNPSNKSKYWYLDDELQEKPPSPKADDVGYTVDEMAQMQAEYTSQPYTGLHGAKKFAAEDDLSNKQKQEIMEQVLIDQLSRHVLSDAEQDRDPARQNPADPTSNFNTAPLRFRSRRLHESKVSTVGAATESKLKDRVTFGARIVTREGRDALRELFGFYFHTDQTLTVYEFRLFGKNTNKALPLIERGKYCHLVGRRKGKNYVTEDFQFGRNLTFSTKNQTHLPDSLKKNSIITMRICETNSSKPASMWDIPSSERGGGEDTALERNDRKVTNNVQKYVRNKLRDRSVSVLVGLGQLFRQLDTSGDGLLNKDELIQVFHRFDISLPRQDFDAVWRVVDENNDGAIDYGEFMRAFIGEMTEPRKLMVRKVFKKLDPHKTGTARFLDLQKLYSAKKHPLVVAGKFSQSEMEEQFITTFADLCSGSEVNFVEFEDYYEGLSIVMNNDDDFINMMRNCWGV